MQVSTMLKPPLLHGIPLLASHFRIWPRPPSSELSLGFPVIEAEGLATQHHRTMNTMSIPCNSFSSAISQVQRG